MSAKVRSTPAPTPFSHPLHLAALALLAGVIVALQAFRSADPELWWQLAVGRHTLSHGLPGASFGTWFDPGTPAAPPHALAGALLAALWGAFGTAAPLVQRSLLALAAFAVAIVAAHRTGPGAKAPAAPHASFALVALVGWCALAGRGFWQAHPLHLAALLLALLLAALEAWRTGADRAAWALPVITLGWAFADASWPVAAGVLLAYLADAWLRRDPRARTLTILVLVSLAATALQPGGLDAVAALATFATSTRHEPLFRTIPDLMPLGRATGLRTLAPALMVAWPLAVLFAPGRSRDWAALIVSAGLAALAFAGARFLGLWAVGCALLLGRDVVRWIAARGPRSPVVRAALAVVALAVVVTMGLRDRLREPGPGLSQDHSPVAAADFLQREGLRGHGFNAAPLGPYLAWRAQGGATPLPFTDLRFRGTADDRRRYVAVFSNAAEWRTLDARHRFDWALLDRYQAPGLDILDRLDGDPDWALVFADDVAALYARRDGADSSAARRLALGVPVGRRGYDTFLDPTGLSTDELERRRAMLTRMVQDSPQHRLAITMLAVTEMALNLPDAALMHARDGLARWPEDPALTAVMTNLGDR